MSAFTRTDSRELAVLEAEILQRMTGDTCRVTRSRGGGYVVVRENRREIQGSRSIWANLRVGEKLYVPTELAHRAGARLATWRAYAANRASVRIVRRTVTLEGGRRMTEFERVA